MSLVIRFVHPVPWPGAATGLALAAASLGCHPAAAASQTPAPLSPAPCGWTLTAQSPIAMVHQGVSATYMLGGPSLMIMLGGTQGQHAGGMIMVSGANGTGVYPVPGGAPSGSGAGSVLTAERHDGTLVALGSGSGDDLVYRGQVVGKYPPPARLTINYWGPNQIRGDLSGTYFDMTAVGQDPPVIVPVPVHVVFTAGSAFSPGGCP